MKRAKELTAATLAIFAMATSVQAAETTGTVSGVNTKTDSITLNDGRSYVLPEGIEAESVKVGEKVKIVFSKHGSKYRVSTLTKSK